MSTPEDIPEDRVEQFPCNCGGNIQFDKKTQCYECDACDFKKGKKIMAKEPDLRSNPDLTRVKDSVIDYILGDCVHEDCDCQHYLFEEVIEAYYGKEVWKYINNRQNEEGE